MALLQLKGTGIQCIADLKGASGTCQRLLLGYRHASGSIYLLDDLAEWRKRADYWPAKSRSLATISSPLIQSGCPRSFSNGIDARDLLKGARKVLIWLFEKGNVQHVLGTCESLLPLFILIPQCDRADLSQELSDF